MNTITQAQSPVSKLEELLNIFGNTCYQLGLQKDWLLPATEARQAVLDHVTELIASATPDTIRRITVLSSNLESVGYRAADRTLEIEFKGGSVYRYLNVPQGLYDDLMDARSAGSFFNSRIKDEFETVKIKS